jgi:hypothetical protein
MKAIITGALDSTLMGKECKSEGEEIPQAAGKRIDFKSDIEKAEIYFKVLREIEFITLKI